VTFNNSNRDFFNTLKAEVDAYFEKNGIKKTGNWRLYLKTAILLPSAVGLYLLLMFVEMPWLLTASLWIVFGFNMAAIGFNIMHDGSHGSYSGNQKVNDIMAYTLNFLGGDAYFWKQKHVVNHHTYTNIEGMDDDLDAGMFFRFHHGQKHRTIHRFQHIYWVVLYGFLYFMWVLSKDMKKYLSRRISPNSPKFKFTTADHFIFWTSKIVHLFLFIVLPLMMVGPKMLIGYVVAAFTLGWILSVVFQLAHVVDSAEFVTPTYTNDKEVIENEWAIHQVKTTADFGTNSAFLTWSLGGLNFQVEHHLFPRISHVHYPALNKIVKETCAEFGIPFLEHKTFLDALKSHVRQLKVMGSEPEGVPALA